MRDLSYSRISALCFRKVWSRIEYLLTFYTRYWSGRLPTSKRSVFTWYNLREFSWRSGDMSGPCQIRRHLSEILHGDRKTCCIFSSGMMPLLFAYTIQDSRCHLPYTGHLERPTTKARPPRVATRRKQQQSSFFRTSWYLSYISTTDHALGKSCCLLGDDAYRTLQSHSSI